MLVELATTRDLRLDDVWFVYTLWLFPQSFDIAELECAILSYFQKVVANQKKSQCGKILFSFLSFKIRNTKCKLLTLLMGYVLQLDFPHVLVVFLMLTRLGLSLFVNTPRRQLWSLFYLVTTRVKILQLELISTQTRLKEGFVSVRVGLWFFYLIFFNFF